MTARLEEMDENSSFIKEVCKYFKDFLEADFKKRRIPKRNSIQKTKQGLQVGLNLEKYGKLKKVLLQQFNKGFKKKTIQIKKGEYVNILPESLLYLIKKKVDDLSSDDLDDIFTNLEKIIEDNATLYLKEYDKFLEETKEQAERILSKWVWSSFLYILDKPLENKKLADENIKYQLELDIVDSLFAVFESGFSEVLQDYFRNSEKETIDIKKRLKEIIQISDIKGTLIKVFDVFEVNDAFFDIQQLYRNNQLIDKTELYLYFYELALGDEKFPVFYTPVAINKEENGFSIVFENRIFLNTKAIEFVVQEYNLQTQNKSSLAGEFDRIIYISDEGTFYNKIETIINTIENFFEFSKKVDISDPALQKTVSLTVSFSNKSYLFLFDKSDEALINDYEEILDNYELMEEFSNILNGFVEKNPIPFFDEIGDEWDEKDITEKLIFESPVPLNDEQKQVLMALNKKDCKIIILEGPPGTGKSHTITAIICRALLEEKSVLVLSDKKEALDVVEDKINTTLKTIRNEDDFQNPILRLGGTGSKFYKIVQGQAIEKIKEHFFSYKHNKEKYDNERATSIELLKKNIKTNITHFESINMENIERYFKEYAEFSAIKWIEGEDIGKLESDFLCVKAVVDKLAKFGPFPFKTSFVKEEHFSLLSALKSEFESLRQMKGSLNNLRAFESDINGLEQYDRQARPSLVEMLRNAGNIFGNLQPKFKDSCISGLSEIQKDMSFSAMRKKQEYFQGISDLCESAKEFLKNSERHIREVHNFLLPDEFLVEDGLKILEAYLKDLKKLRNIVFGYLWKRERIDDLTRKLKKTFHFFNVETPEKKQDMLTAIYDLYEFIYSKVRNREDRNALFREVVNLLIENERPEHLANHEELKSSFSNLANELDKLLSGFGDMRFSDILNQITLVAIIDTIERISNYRNLISDKQLAICIESDHLKFESIKEDIVYLEEVLKSLGQLLEIEKDIKFLEEFQKNNPQLSKRIHLDTTSQGIDKLRCDLSDFSNETIERYFKYKEIEHELNKKFKEQPKDIYSQTIANVEQLTTAQMTYFLDERIINYINNFPGDVQNLKGIIRKKQKFPKGLFENLRKAFPCILAGIRDYAEYIPLEKDLFDLIIIDEASQVSIAQALPALIRGKKVVILGDEQQFSNVKASNASKVINQEYKSRVNSSFAEERIRGEDTKGWMNKVKDNFDIKNSILKFSRFIRNYDCRLKKHFRCYPEIISYSDEHFYDRTLQCTKIRGKDIEEIIKFDIIPHDGKIDKFLNTNELEVDFIISKLKEFEEKNIVQSLGIITPHREQATLLSNKIYELPWKKWLFDECKLKIMTFDTCQGEERDYIFYSMVATREKDRLKWVFLKDFKSINDEIEGTIKAQRLNVGFSRAKECIHFVLSKPIEEFQGEIRNALIHYKKELEEGKSKVVGGTDERSPMEREIQHYFYETHFHKENKKDIRFVPQFPIGDYLRQLDKHYIHPKYKVDFLLIYKEKKIIIEYDGFKEHFSSLDEIDRSNYKYYMNADDVYRQKVLEGYGYEFLRINKFNLGDDPIETLNGRLEDIVKKKSPILR